MEAAGWSCGTTGGPLRTVRRTGPDVSTSPDTVVVYQVMIAVDGSAQLTRQVGILGATETVAHHVIAMQAKTLHDPFLQIDLTFRHPGGGLIIRPSSAYLERTYSLIATQP